MKRLLFTIFSCAPLLSFAQIGPAIVFTYDNAGYRIKREYVAITSYQKPGRDANDLVADTLIGIYKHEPVDSVHYSKPFVKSYPNPSNGLFYVENLSWEEGENIEIRITDITGRVILRKKIHSSKEQVNISNASAGNYQVLYYINNVLIITWKITKI